MFDLVGKQKVRHDSGYIVEILDRQTVRYVDGHCSATMAVDFGPTTAIYVDTLTMTRNGVGDPGPPVDAETVRDRVVNGLHALGLTCDIAMANNQ